MCGNLAKNRAVIVNKNDVKELEFMLWMLDIRMTGSYGEIWDSNVKLNPNYTIVTFRCCDSKYHTIYEKMDSLGMWKGELINPKIYGDYIACDEINVINENMSNRYLKIGVL